MNIKQTLLGCTLASFMFAACSSDDSGTGGSSGSCDVSALPASDLSFESRDGGCYAEGSMDLLAFATYMTNLTNSGWLPVSANPSPDGQSGDYVFSKQEGAVTHTVTLTNSAGAVTAVYVKTGDEGGDANTNPGGPNSSGNPNASVPNASQCDLATKRLPASSLAWQPTFAGGCEVLQEFALADLQTLDQQLQDLGFEKKSLSAESYKYLRADWSFEEAKEYKDTLAFVYAMGTFTGTFSSGSRELTSAEKTRINLYNAYTAIVTADLLGDDPLPYIAQSKLIEPYDKSEYLYVYGRMPFTRAAFKDKMTNAGWTCSVSSSISCKKAYDGTTYHFIYYINDPSSPSARTIEGYFSKNGYSGSLK